MGVVLSCFLLLLALLAAFLVVVALPVFLLGVCAPIHDFVFAYPFLLEAYRTICFWPLCSARRCMMACSKRCCGGAGPEFLYVDVSRGGRAHLLDSSELPAIAEPGLVVRCIVVSDTHGLQDTLPPLPKADVLVICGNILLQDRAADAKIMAELASLDRWLASHGSTIPERVVVAGCHDVACEELGAEKVRRLLPNAIYLQDEQKTLSCGLLIFGSPRSMQQSERPGNRAFQTPKLDEDLPEAVIDSIPAGLDLLITHGAPAGTTPDYQGSRRLLQSVKALRPTAHVYGHARQGFGAKVLAAGKVASENAVVFANCTSTDSLYAVVNPPVVLDIPIQRLD